MPNPRIAQLISERLRSGLTHPGDPAHDVPAKQLVLPFGRQAGMPEEMTRLVDATVKQLGEAIVYLIESEGESAIVDRLVYEDQQAQLMPPPVKRVIPVHCRCDKRWTDPLMMLSVDARPRIIVDGAQLIEQLSKRDVNCPHGRGQG